jgi:hypothetical protein
MVKRWKSRAKVTTTDLYSDAMMRIEKNRCEAVPTATQLWWWKEKQEMALW